MYLNRWSEDPEHNRLTGIKHGRRALVVGGDDPGTLGNAAYALAYFGEDIGTMIGFVERPLTLNPSFARGWYLLAWMRMWAGDIESAFEPLENSLRLSPRARVGDQSLGFGAGHFMMRRFDETVPKLLLAIRENPNNPHPYRYLASCYVYMDRLDEAREVVGRLRAITTSVMPSATHWRNPEHSEFFLSGLRLAMGEAG